MTVEEPATCTKDGVQKIHCTVCNEVIEQEVIPALGHQYEDEIISPTCTEMGYTLHTCKLCGESYKDEFTEAKGHSLSEWIVIQNASCTKAGKKTRKCSECDYLENEEIPAKGHHYTIEVIEPDCLKQGYTLHTCDVCGDSFKDTTVKALGHDFSEWLVQEPANCTKTGILVRNCSRCDEKETKEIPMLAHTYKSEVIEPTCTEQGYTLHTCTNCGDAYKTDTTDALGHSFGDWAIRKDSTCVKDGVKYHVCERCNFEDTAVIDAKGHTPDVKKIESEATCTIDGVEVIRCKECNAIISSDTIPAYGHTFSEWKIEKEPTVLANGIQSRVCNICGHIENEDIPKIVVDTANDANYGVANFSIVDAVTLEPISKATLQIVTETEGECAVSTDENGKLSQILPVGKVLVSICKEGYLPRNIEINVLSGEQDIPEIGISEKATVQGNLTVKEMTIEEIKEAGIDTNAKGNNHIFKYEAKIEFEPEVDWISIVSYINDKGVPVFPVDTVNDSDEEPSEEKKTEEKKEIYYHGNVTPIERGNGIGYGVTLKDGTEVTIYPVSEKFYLIIYGEVKWLKEMFDVELLVLNSSQTDTIEDCTAVLTLPEGMSLAEMVDGEQNLEQTIDFIDKGQNQSIHWYVRGDKEGTYNISATLSGKTMPFAEEFHYEYEAQSPIKVYAGSAMQLTFEIPDAAFYNQDYTVKITLENVSNKTLYNVNHAITGLKQCKITYYSDGSEEETIYKDSGFLKSENSAEFKPGDKIVIEATTNIMFQSEIIENELQKMTDFVDNAENLLNAYKAFKAGIDAAGTIYHFVDDASKNLDAFVNSEFDESKRSVAKELKDQLDKLSEKYERGQSEAFSLSTELMDTGLDVLESIAEDESFDLEQLEDYKEFLENILKNEDTQKKTTAFDAVRGIISMIPVRFVVRNMMVTTMDGSTTEIPCTFKTYPAGTQYFGVDHIDRFLYDTAILAFGEVETPFWAKQLGVKDDLTGYHQAEENIKMTLQQAEQFAVKNTNASGDSTCKAWIEPASSAVSDTSQVKRKPAQASTGNFILETNSENCSFENDILTFTGNCILSVTPTTLGTGTLCIQSENGDIVRYYLETVESHKCDSDQWISLMDSQEGYKVKLCDICNSLIAVENIEQNDSTDLKDESTTQTTAMEETTSTSQTTTTTKEETISTTQTTTTTEGTTSITQTTPTTTEETTSTTQITTTADTTKYFASVDELENMAVKDYEKKTGTTPANKNSVTNEDGTVSIQLSDAEGNVLDVYVIDPVSGTGENGKGEEINLPQTGNNSKASLTIVFVAFMAIFAGTFAIVKSGIVRKRKED